MQFYCHDFDQNGPPYRHALELHIQAGASLWSIVGASTSLLSKFSLRPFPAAWHLGLGIWPQRNIKPEVFPDEASCDYFVISKSKILAC